MEAWKASHWRLPVLSGVLLAAAYFAVPPLLPNFVAFLPMLLWLDANRDRPRKERLRAAFLFGLLAYLLGLTWMRSMLEYSWLAAVLYIALAFGFAAYATAALTLAAWLRHSARWSWGASLPVAWISLEWERNLTDLRMTADHMGHTLAGYPFLVQFADLVGPYGVGALLLAANGLLYEAWRSRGRPAGRRAALVLAGFGAVVLLYDAWAWTHPPQPSRTVRVGIVQPNVPLDVKHGLKTEAEQWRTLSAMSQEATDRGAQIVIWPETSRPWPLRHWVDRGTTFVMPETQALARRTKADYVVGVEYYRIRDVGHQDFYNASMVVHANGVIDSEWSAKIYLVPFVEGIPFEGVLGPVLAGREGEMRWMAGGFSRGPRVNPLPVRDLRVGTMICYEELYFDLARRLRNAGADFVAIMTNDAWFGRTFFQGYQANTVRMRAIENRCAFVRVANTGISGFVDPLGRYHGWTDLDVAATEVHEVPLIPGRSVYGRTGDVVAWLAIAGLGAGIWASARADRRLRRREEMS
ncbi:MAG: apolipoprotein N-acyltransferase [Acidobacteriia bacterium]|nr:apolipoprotein N-acyltransferase [Terriglobia bacterium]